MALHARRIRSRRSSQTWPANLSPRGTIALLLGVALVPFLLTPCIAQAKVEQGHPEAYENFHLVGTKSTPSFQFAWGQIDLESKQLGSEGIECMNVGFGDAYNEGASARAFGQVLDWSAAAHETLGKFSKLSGRCRPEITAKPASFATDEAFVVSEENGHKEVEPPLRNLTVPWNVELTCGVREEEDIAIARIGVPTTEFPHAGNPPCPASLETGENEEDAAYVNEREEKRGCYVTNPAPAGCIRLTIVEPGSGLEVGFGGTLRATVENGVKNGLFPTKLAFVPASGALQCEFPSGCSATASATGWLADDGYHNVALEQAR